MMILFQAESPLERGLHSFIQLNHLLVPSCSPAFLLIKPVGGGRSTRIFSSDEKIGVPPAVDELIQDSNVDRGILSQPFCEESGKLCPFTLIAPSHLNLKYVNILSFDPDLPDLVVSRGRCRNSSGRHFSSPPASRASH